MPVKKVSIKQNKSQTLLPWWRDDRRMWNYVFLIFSSIGLEPWRAQNSVKMVKFKLFTHFEPLWVIFWAITLFWKKYGKNGFILFIQFSLDANELWNHNLLLHPL